MRAALVLAALLAGCRPQAPAPAPTPTPAPPPPPKVEYKAVGFDLLAGFSYRYPDFPPEDGKPTASFAEIPAAVRTLDGTPILLKGYMVPMSNKLDDTSRFLISKLPCACCFKTAPRTNEYVDVRPKYPKRVVFDHSGIVTVKGVLTVKEVCTEEGWVESIYQLVADDVSRDVKK